MAIAECALSQTYMEIHAFLGLVDHYWQFIKGFAQITQPLNEHLAGEGALGVDPCPQGEAPWERLKGWDIGACPSNTW